ncbi:hypothetical protein WEH80_34020 [Actinomycetes bacterium KLBMP 9759]
MSARPWARSWPGTVGAALLLALIALLVPAAFGAAAATEVQRPAAATPQPNPPSGSADTPLPSCSVVIGKAPKGTKSSPMLEKKCSDAGADVTMADRVLLITLYEHADFVGASISVYGNAGPCDREGYGIEDLGAWFGIEWEYRISSFNGASNCQDVDGYELDYYRWSVGNWEPAYVPYVGDRANDKIESLWVRSAY